MGLDIYINVRKSRINSKKEREVVASEEFLYFRKVNFLVAYFEQSIGELENCKEYPISKDEVIDLIERCTEVLEHPEQGPKILPTTEGFFFGNTEYGEIYLRNVDDILYKFENIVLPTFDAIDPELDDITIKIWY